MPKDLSNTAGRSKPAKAVYDVYAVLRRSLLFTNTAINEFLRQRTLLLDYLVDNSKLDPATVCPVALPTLPNPADLSSDTVKRPQVACVATDSLVAPSGERMYLMFVETYVHRPNKKDGYRQRNVRQFLQST